MARPLSSSQPVLLSLAEARREVPREQLVITQRGTVRALVTGGGPDVLLLHGVTDNAESFTDLIARLARQVRVHALDLPGHGLSDLPARPLGLAEMAEVVSAYMETVRLDRVVVVGWSMGGGVALRLATSAPHRVAAVVLLGSIGLPFKMPRKIGLLRLHGAGEAMPWLGLSPQLRRELLADTFHPRFTPSETVIDRYWQPWRVRGRGRYLRGLLRLPHGQDQDRFWRHLPELAIPLYVLHGDSDRIVPVDVARGLASRVRGAILHVLAGTGHSPHIERPDETLDAILAAVQRGFGISR